MSKEDKEISNINEKQIVLIAQSEISDKATILNEQLNNIDKVRNSQISEVKAHFKNKRR